MHLLHAIAEGGQTWAHRVRMVRQVVKIALMMALTLSIAVVAYESSKLDPIYYQSFWYQQKAQVVGTLSDKVSVRNDFWYRVARQRHRDKQVSVPCTQLLRQTQPYSKAFVAKMWEQLTWAGSIYVWILGGFLGFFLIRGGRSRKSEHISGRKVQPAWWLALRLRITGQASSISIGRLPMVKGTETQHTLVTGGTGSGKTNCFHTILPQIRRLGQRAVIVDTTGAFIERYYREGKDVILNPFDDRTKPWHPWVECRDRFDYDSLAESLIPSSHCEKENYWRSAAQSVVKSTLEKMDDVQQLSNFIRLTLHEPLDILADFLQGTKAASHIDTRSEKTAGSIRSVTSSFIDCLEYLPDTDQPFSIRDWVANEDQDSWLFLSCSMSQRSALRPLMSTWVSIAMRSLLNLPPDIDRRLWFVIDELPSLQRLKDFETFLTESRKFGGCGLFAIQSPAQIESVYGWQAARVILGNCLTRIAFYEHDPEIAEKLSKLFGSQEVREYQEGISYGAHEMRDGVSLSSQSKQKPVITANDLATLKKHQAYVKLPGNVALSKIRLGKA